MRIKKNLALMFSLKKDEENLNPVIILHFILFFLCVILQY